MRGPELRRNIKLVLEYDGAAFFGFQRQPRHATVQETLENALSRLFDQPLKIESASGRTDTGVHARAQTVNFRTSSPMACGAIRKALNGILPPAIAVKEVREAAQDFHARFGAAGKTYEYRIWNSPVRSPLRAAQSCHVMRKLDITAMRRSAKVLKGRHDFRSLSAQDASRKGERNSVRTIRKLSVRREGSMVLIRVEADGFLYRMVRNIAGMLVEAGLGRISPARTREILQAKDRRLAPKTMPAQGLMLISVKYPAVRLKR